MNRVIPILFLVLSACGSSTPNPAPTPVPVGTDTANTAAKITQYTSEAVAVGLSFYGNTNAAQAKAVATQIQAIVTNTILPYLNGNQNVTSLAIDAFLKENLVNLPAIIQAAITTGATILDHYIQAPSATTYLSPTEYAYVRAFAQGLSNGAGQFLAGNIKTVKEAPEKTAGHWVNFAK